MLDTLELGVRLSLERAVPETGTIDRVRDILDRPLLPTMENRGLSWCLTEDWLKEVLKRDDVSHYFRGVLTKSRLVAYADGVDRLGVPRLVFLYYSEDDTLTLTEVQKWVASTTILTQEWTEDREVLDLFFARGYLPYLPAGAYPMEESL